MDTINLDTAALEIARKRLLQGVSYKELAKQYYTSPSTIHRRLTAWLKENRFELADRLSPARAAFITGKDDDLAAELVRRSGIWRARIVRISGVEPAYTEQYQDDPHSESGRQALKAADDLHRCLGEAAAEIFLNSLRKNMTIGISSGRGVGFMVEALAENVRRAPSWVSGYAGLRLISLCGGVHAGRWEQNQAGGRDFDADENVFALAAALEIARRDITYISGPLAAAPPPDETESRLNLDIAVIGLGQLNTRRHFFRDLIEHRSAAADEPLQIIMEWQQKEPSLCDNLAEIAMKLYPSGRGPLPQDFTRAVKEMNRSILSVPPAAILKAGEVVLIAGGRQKMEALRGLLRGEYPDAPIDRRNLTLVTDAWTARMILK